MIYRLSPLLLAAFVAFGAFATDVAAVTRQPADASEAPGETQDLRRLPAPLGGYRPHFVHQTQNNCAFASAAMLIDKWTRGNRRPAQDRLRAASRVPTTEGVGISQLAHAVERATGINVGWSPGGGDPLTWEALMQRLGRGGAAVVAGSYSRLPRYYTRWGRDYAALGANQSGHALYVERYEPGRRGGRVWIMDPLANSSGYRGEWLSASALRRFVWRSNGGLVHALATPEPPPLAGYEFGDPALAGDAPALAGTDVTIAVPVDVRSGWSMPRNLALSVVWHPLTLDPDPDEVAELYASEVAAARTAAEHDSVTEGTTTTAPNRPDPRLDDGPSSAHTASTADAAEDLALWRSAEAPDGSEDTGDESDDDDSAPDAEENPAAADDGAGQAALDPSDPMLVLLDARGGRLVGSLRAPKAAGTYRVTVSLRHRDGSRFSDGAAPSLADFTTYLGGPLAAQYEADIAPDHLVAGTVATVEVEVANLGSLDWAEDDSAELVATWETERGSSLAGRASVELVSLDESEVDLLVIVPTDARSGDLVVELLTGDGVPFTLHGADPVVLPLAFSAAGLAGDVPSVPQE